DLARSLFEHVVRVLQKSTYIDAVAAVSDSVQPLELAERMGVLALSDADESRGLAEVVDSALQKLEERGATSVLICMSDLPDLTTEDITGVAQQLERSDVVLVPDLAKRGTNVIAVKPATVLPSCLGHDDSLQRHHEVARRLGLVVSFQASSGIGFDVDRPADLDRLHRR
ncbi:MAG: NTP transferase domain-containing protein, partial [Deltaproteobacteria bacterium]|nr:NTP transferase domain-containing protein [Deltaproteobacteria bacterium]